MKSKNTIDTSIKVRKNINEDNLHITNRRIYITPELIRLADSTIEGGTTTNLAEATGGVWNAGS